MEKRLSLPFPRWQGHAELLGVTVPASKLPPNEYKCRARQQANKTFKSAYSYLFNTGERKYLQTSCFSLKACGTIISHEVKVLHKESGLKADTVCTTIIDMSC